MPDSLSTESDELFVFAAAGGGGGGINGWAGRVLAMVAVVVAVAVASEIRRSPASIKPANASIRAGTNRSNRCCCRGCCIGVVGVAGGRDNRDGAAAP